MRIHFDAMELKHSSLKICFVKIRTLLSDGTDNFIQSPKKTNIPCLEKMYL